MRQCSHAKDMQGRKSSLCAKEVTRYWLPQVADRTTLLGVRLGLSPASTQMSSRTLDSDPATPDRLALTPASTPCKAGPRYLWGLPVAPTGENLIGCSQDHGRINATKDILRFVLGRDRHLLGGIMRLLRTQSQAP